MEKYKLLVITFLIKLYALNNIFKQLIGKYGQATVTIARNLERTRIKMAKLKSDLKFLSTCKKHKLIPVFAKPKISIKVNKALRQKIAKTIIEAEIGRKHKRMKYLKKESKENLKKLQEKLGMISLCALDKAIRRRIKGKQLGWNKIHEKKLAKLFEEITPAPPKQRPRNVVHNFSSYELTAEEYHLLTYGLDHHIPGKLSENEVKTEFETFFFALNKHLGHLSSEEKDEMKSKLRRSCENFYKSSRKESKLDGIIKNISKNKNIRILKQDKGRGIVIMDANKYIDKCMEMLNTDNFQKVGENKTKEVEEAVQKSLFNIKKAIGGEKYKEIYPSGSNPGKFYGTAKIHKVKPTDIDKVSKLPLRPIVSNIGTATHKTAQYLSELLSPLAKSKYTIQSTRDFVERIRKIEVPRGYKMISFDVVSLFTNVPLDATIDIILRKVYVEKQIRTKIKKEQMRELLLLCTKEVPFSFNNQLYMQVDGVMMGSPLGPLFANIFMCELENTLIPKLSMITNWMRYVDDTFAFIKPGEEEYVKNELDNYHQNIKFTYEMEKDGKLPFLDVMITKNEDTSTSLETSVYRKVTNTDIYMNWKAHAPTTWKIATLKSLVKRAITISSTKKAAEQELKHVKNVFCNLNDYPEGLVERIITDEKLKTVEAEKAAEDERNGEEDKDDEIEKVSLALNLPYAGDKGDKIIQKMQKDLVGKLNTNTKRISVCTMYRSTKLSTRFNIKDKTNHQDLHNVVYHVSCPNKKCKSTYCGETRRRLGKRIDEHREKDKKSHVRIHTEKTKHKKVRAEDFKVLGQRYKSNFRRKISEALFIKTTKPDLNIQKESYRLLLFN